MVMSITSVQKAEKVVDFRGRCMDRELVEKGTLLEACLDSDRSLQQHLVYTGLAGGGRHLAHLEAAVCFTVSAKHRVKKMAGPMEVGEDGRVYAAVEFPAMSELWPDVFFCRAIRIVQVDMFVVVKSGNTRTRYPGTELKVTYKRPRIPADDVVLWRPQDIPHTVGVKKNVVNA